MIGRRLAMAGTIVAAALAAGCGGGGEPEQAGPSTPETETATTERSRGTSAAVPRDRPAVGSWEPGPGEDYPNAKRIAADAALRALTYAPGSSRETLRDALPGDGDRASLDAFDGLDRRARSRAEVVYVQLSGVTPTTLGTMIVVRQRLQDADGRQRTETRTVDVRLQRAGGPWRLDRLAGVGGSPVRRTGGLSFAARRVLDHRNLFLPDSARWDIIRGRVDQQLLQRLAAAADRRPMSVLVFATGHPVNVWQTDRPSAHSRGAAVDIYAVGGRLVARQRDEEGPAKTLTRELLADGARQVGSPWVLPPGAPRSFTDPVHKDHIHLQQGAASAAG